MDYDDPTLRPAMDLEGVKRWLPGDKGGYATLTRGDARAGLPGVTHAARRGGDARARRRARGARLARRSRHVRRRRRARGRRRLALGRARAAGLGAPIAGHERRSTSGATATRSSYASARGGDARARAPPRRRAARPRADGGSRPSELRRHRRRRRRRSADRAAGLVPLGALAEQPAAALRLGAQRAATAIWTDKLAGLADRAARAQWDATDRHPLGGGARAASPTSSEASPR